MIIVGDVVQLHGAWKLRQAGTQDWIPATVPGCVHTDLLAAGRISDPLVGMNELSGETQRLQSLSFRTLEFFMVAAVMYFLITKFVLFSASLFSQKLFKGDI